MNTKFSRVVIFGGTGFVSAHLADHFLAQNLASEIVLADIKPPRRRKYWQRFSEGLKSGRVRYCQSDVRSPISVAEVSDSADLIINLAAVHREPGHSEPEYHETNIAGARNVCTYATAVGCPRMVFSSSIAVYGGLDERVNEETTPTPNTAYGISKLVAEEIHKSWCEEAPGRTLLTLRPGVLYGPGEGGNVSRLVKAVRHGYFVYTGNHNTEKSGGYIREFCRVVSFCLDWQRQNRQPYLLANFSSFPPPKFSDYVQTIEAVLGRRSLRPSIPLPALLAASTIISAAASALNINQPINPIRVRKLVRSNRVEARTLQSLGYQNAYPDLLSAFLDWKALHPADFE